MQFLRSSLALTLLSLPALAQERTWIRQFGSAGYDIVAAAISDGTGNPLWIVQLGTSADEEVSSLAMDAVGGAYVGGWTAGSLGGTNAG